MIYAFRKEWGAADGATHAFIGLEKHRTTANVQFILMNTPFSAIFNFTVQIPYELARLN
jgi:hypothetical protein